MESFLRIAGLTFAIRAEDARIGWEWDGAVRRFLTTASPADVDILVESFDGEALEGETVFESEAVWRLVRAHDGFAIECRSEAFGDAPYKVARFNERFTRGTISLRRDLLPLRLNPLDYPIDEVIVSNILGRGTGVELHSCGIIDAQGRGHLFAGVSGAGKTTMARLWGEEAREVVSDDRVIVREHDGGIRMFGTPWHGEAELSSPSSAPLAGVYLLVQAPEAEVRRLGAAEAVARLFGCTFPLFADHAAIDFTLGFLERLTTAIPVRELRFARERGVVGLVLREAS